MQMLSAMIANIHTIRYLERKERPLLMLSAIFWYSHTIENRHIVHHFFSSFLISSMLGALPIATSLPSM